MSAMIISGSTLQLSSSHSYLEYQRRHESLSAWRQGPDGRQQINLESTRETLRMGGSGDRLTLSQAALAPPPQVPLQPADRPAVNAAPASSEVDASAQDIDELKFVALRLLVEQLTGRPVQVFDARELKADPATTPQLPPDLPGTSVDGRVGWGATYSVEDTHLESETTQFTAQGTVRTAEGKEITLSLTLNMSREFVSHTRLSVRAGDALKDPLVINFAGTAAQLTQTRFSFDLDADGSVEQTYFVAPGSGFLALDRNGDGKINDGRELFGALSGNGFADLARFDDDGNGWIDEGDAVFSRLRVWSRDGDGADRLQGLLQLGIGAIHLDQAATPFAIKDASNALQGAVRASGIFLREDGGAGTVQQIDLVV